MAFRRSISFVCEVVHLAGANSYGVSVMLNELLEVEAATKLVDDLSDRSILHTQLDQGPGFLSLLRQS